jgi:hypothetical protein
MKKRFWKCLVVFCSVLVLLGGCEIREKEDLSAYTLDLSAYTLEMLQSVTPRFIDYTGTKTTKRLVTIDISAFDSQLTEGYAEWVKESFGNEDTTIMVIEDEEKSFSEADLADALSALEELPDDTDDTYDWTKICIERDSDEAMKSTEMLTATLSYPIIMENEEFKVEMEYHNQA